MRNTLKSVGPVYVHVIGVRPPKWFTRTWTQEIELPYREGLSLLFRIPLVKVCIAFGKWHSTGTEDESLMRAVGGRIIGDIDALEQEEKLSLSLVE